MDWFGLTALGYDSPIQDFMRPEYKEPTEPPKSYLEIKNPLQKSLAARLEELDCYLGRADGFAYGSNDRLAKMKKRGLYKNVGPMEMYWRPGTTAMDYGFWMCDKIFEGKTYYKPYYYHHKKTSEITKERHRLLLRDLHFKFTK